MKQLELFPSENDGTPIEKKSEKRSVERRRCVSTVYAPLKRTGALLPKTEPTQETEKSLVDAKKQALWESYWAKPCDQTRNDLSLAYLALVKMIAEGLKDKFPTHVDVNDLVSTGYIGLLDAISKFNPNLNIKFESYSVMRIRGEILDSIRHQDIVPRQVRILQNNYRRALKDLARTLHREPSEEELAAHMKLTAKQFETLIHSFSSGRIVSIDAGSEDKSGNNAPHVDKMPTPNEKSPSYDMQRGEALELILRGLSPKEKAVVIGYYMEGQTMKQIGESLNLSESRVCQIHMEFLVTKRKKLGGFDEVNPE